jgi:hypothetical protein
MKTTAIDTKTIGRATIAAITLSAGVAFAAGTTPESTSAGPPVIVAQAAMPAATTVVVRTRTYPDYMARAVAAAAEGPEALRRYLWRTRMIYNFYYPDFIPQS